METLKCGTLRDAAASSDGGFMPQEEAAIETEMLFL
jgi:hypothetical protein